MRLFNLFGALALASSAFAQNATYCTNTGCVCYAVNVPASTASTGNGDIYFQMTSPSNMSWIGLGQGMEMMGANIFLVYANAAGTNVTLSSRLGIGEEPPETGSPANVTLLGGSGISNGMIVANVKCSNCNSWPGGITDFKDSNSNWIYAFKAGAPLSSDSVDAPIMKHDVKGTMMFNLQTATGGDSANPFEKVMAFSSFASDSSWMSSEGGVPSNFVSILMAHGILAAIAFVLFFPFGSISMRLLNFRNLIWFHAAWMLFSYAIALVAMGLGVWIVVTDDYLDTYHATIGLVVIGCLVLQPITGLIHHKFYNRSGRPNLATYPHVWWGRAVLTLGIINGGFGLQLADSMRTGTIVYGVLAGVIWVTWMVVIFFTAL